MPFQIKQNTLNLSVPIERLAGAYYRIQRTKQNISLSCLAKELRMNKGFLSDLENICNSKFLNFNFFDNKTIFITGATGLIGFNIVSSLLHYSKNNKNAPQIIALVRNIDKAKKMYSNIYNANLRFCVNDIINKINYDGKVDYIIHTASETSSKVFVENPVKTINTSIIGTKNILDFAKEKDIKSMVYLSTMEIYGENLNDEKISENNYFILDNLKVRSSYPESKRMCENLCIAYLSEYNVPVKIVRLTQTFGPGVTYEDKRVFAEFARCVIEKKDIVLHTIGETKRSYLYTADAVTAIFTILLYGKNGEAYNAANENTYCSIYEMAELVANSFSEKNIKVKIVCENVNNFGYAPTVKLNLDTSKLRSLGWKPKLHLKEMYDRLITCLETEILCK